MLDTIEKPNLQDELGLAQLVGAVIMLAGLVFALCTENVRVWSLFTLVGGGVGIIDYYIKKVTSPRPALSLFDAPENPKTKIQYGPLVWVGLALMLAACISFMHIRISALLMISGFCVLLFNRYNRARS